MAARANATIVWKADAWKAAAMPAINAGLYAAATVMSDQAQTDLSTGRYPPSSPAGGPPAMDSGNLHRSITAVTPEALGTPGHAAFGTALPYGRYLEFGATIRARRTKYLKIPVDRRLAEKVERGNIPLVLIKSKDKDQAVLVLKSALAVWRGKRTSPTGKAGNFKLPAGSVVYVLKKQVTIRSRPWIVNAAMKARPTATTAFARVSGAEFKARGLSL